MFEEKYLTLHPKTRKNLGLMSDSNDNRTRRHPVELPAGHLFI